ncbi:hypothetical protein PR202_ga24171 [Eleusine coracana subsp. coracana]|uniref:Uncharacterized protein n=1 Tax=Eleusine coracana subsp. coracana TaxID=191504 RepID=A0AAV5D865_ELECO|nr:hypothetical protein PR202_ga24171 [Eleusine coracana subsp. coracana]
MVQFAIGGDRDRSMELVMGALPNLLPKLCDLLVGHYKLQKGVKGEIRFVLSELGTMKSDLEKDLSTSAAHLDDLDEIWARQVRELSYDLEDRIDTFMVRSIGSDPVRQHDSKRFFDRSLNLLAQPNVLREIAIDIKDIKYRVQRICSMGSWCTAAKPVSVDPHLSVLYKERAELIGIAEARNELTSILMEGNEVSKQQVNIVSIVGFGGLGKTALANAVYEKLRAQFDCSAFVLVSQNFDLKKLFKEIVYQLGMEKDNKGTLDDMQLINELREFLQEKRALLYSKIFGNQESEKCLDEELVELRYLGLRCTGIAKLPEEVGNLRFLRTLDVKYNGISELPMTVVNLRELMCLHIDGATRVPKGWLANLTSLEELSGSIYDVTDIEDLGYLTQLRVLDISCHIECMDTLQKYLVQSLSKLQKVQDFCIQVASNECKVDDFVFPRHVHRLVLRGCWLSKLPAWVNPSFLLELSVLSIAIIEVQQEHLDVLGMLRSLRYLNLKVDNENLGIQRRFIVRTCLFPCLEWCMLWGFRGPVVFERGAMLNLTSLRFTFHVQDMREITGGSDDAFDMFFRNLPSLQDVIVLLRCGGASETEVVEAKAALRHASEIHLNRPTIEIMG